MPFLDSFRGNTKSELESVRAERDMLLIQLQQGNMVYSALQGQFHQVQVERNGLLSQVTACVN